MSERETKRLRISIEPHQEKRIYSTEPNGEELFLAEKTPSEKFAALVATIDFDQLIKSEKSQDDNNPSPLSEPKKDKPDTIQQVWPWYPVAERLSHACNELDQLIELTSLLANDKLNTANITKVNGNVILEKERDARAVEEARRRVVQQFNRDLYLKESIKKEEMSQAASILQRGKTQLADMVAIDKTFFNDLLHIRRDWLLSSRPVVSKKSQQPTGRPTGKLYVDHSFRTAGSATRLEAEVVRGPTGNVSLVFPVEYNRRLRIFTSHGDNLQRISSNVPKDDADCFSKLEFSHQSQYDSELFGMMIANASSKKIPNIEVMDNDIQIHGGKDSILTIQLRSVSPATNQTPIIAPSDRQNPACVPVQVMDIALQQLLNRHYAEASNNALRLHPILDRKNPDKFVFTTDLADVHRNTGNVLESASVLFRHQSFCREMDVILDAIVRDLPQSSVHWTSVPHPSRYQSTFKFRFGQIMETDVLIDKLVIHFGDTCGPKRISQTPSELGQFILTQVSNYVLDFIVLSASVMGVRTRRSLWSVALFHPSCITTMGLIAGDKYRLKVKVVCAVTGEGRQTRELHWNDLKGATVEDKLTQLLSETPFAISGQEKKE
ncbi:hypothetical protein PROFUN_02393 [Planoprotostelium fungivorum]|uniref:Uncharacterized protein n=1 Tax=Planoprotostelium fungivorum TaxID=1890364 RepID=A0A2P6NUQ1_9EUKA|nr:hypothetical protein PROFUN_02393 [Planoprotostelium fungivorum]